MMKLVVFGKWCLGSGGKWESLKMNQQWEVPGIEPTAGRKQSWQGRIVVYALLPMSGTSPPSVVSAYTTHFSYEHQTPSPLLTDH